MQPVPANPIQPMTFTITIEAQPMQVKYTPDYFPAFPVGRFEFFSPHTPRRRIPVSETGYKSHFAPLPQIEAAPSPQEYAHALALALIRNGAARTTDDDDDDQLAMF